jgi:hypothetical protein
VRGLSLVAAVVLPLAGCGLVLGNDEEATPSAGDARSDGGDGPSSADVITAEGGASGNAGDGGGAGDDGSTVSCKAASATCNDPSECCPGLACQQGTFPKAAGLCCAGFGDPCTSPGDCCPTEANITILCVGDAGQMTCQADL